jgi:hypothetical protein
MKSKLIPNNSLALDVTIGLGAMPVRYIEAEIKLA